MADMNSFMKKVGKATEKAIDKGAYVADIAVTKTKIKTEEMKLNKQYAALGRLYFDTVKEADIPEDFEPVIDKINAIIDKIGVLETEYRNKKAKNTAKKNCTKGETQTKNTYEGEFEDCDN